MKTTVFIDCCHWVIVLSMGCCLCYHAPANPPDVPQSERARSLLQKLRGRCSEMRPGEPCGSKEKVSKLGQDIWGANPGMHYFDMHGNAWKETRDLMKLRFAASRPICEEIDSIDRSRFPLYTAALYRVLAFVKDPATIPWLESKRQQGREWELHEYWLPFCRTDPGAMFFYGATFSQMQWFTGAGEWSRLFRRWHEQERDGERRVSLVVTLLGWCHDEETIAYFAALEKRPETKGRELMLAQVYLWQHGRPYDRQKLGSTIKELGASADNHRFLLGCANELPDDQFVPLLISILDKEPPATGYMMNNSRRALWSLGEISLRTDISTVAGWKEWFAAHGREGRETWIQQARQAIRQIETILATDPKKGMVAFGKVKYTWSDPVFLPQMMNLARFRVVHDWLVDWINSSCMRPYWREQYRPLAGKIIEESTKDLDEVNILILRDLGFMGPPMKATWEAYVEWYNSRI